MCRLLGFCLLRSASISVLSSWLLSSPLCEYKCVVVLAFVFSALSLSLSLSFSRSSFPGDGYLSNDQPTHTPAFHKNKKDKTGKKVARQTRADVCAVGLRLLVDDDGRGLRSRWGHRVVRCTTTTTAAAATTTTTTTREELLPPPWPFEGREWNGQRTTNNGHMKITFVMHEVRAPTNMRYILSFVWVFCQIV